MNILSYDIIKIITNQLNFFNKIKLSYVNKYFNNTINEILRESIINSPFNNLNNNILMNIINHINNKNKIKLHYVNIFFKNYTQNIWKNIGLSNNLNPPLNKARVYKTWKSIVLKYCHKLCDNCGTFFGSYNDFFIIYLCSKCDKLEKYKLICKSTAKTEYLLKDSHLENISGFSVQNPHYRNASPMILYKLCDIKQLSTIIYNDIEKEKETRRLSREKRSNNKNKKILDRNTILIDTLTKTGLTYRDNYTCSRFIEGKTNDCFEYTGAPTLKDTVNKMFELEFLYTKTNYQQILSNMFDNAKKDRRDYGERYDPELIKLDAQCEALSNWKKKILKTKKILEPTDVNINGHLVDIDSELWNFLNNEI